MGNKIVMLISMAVFLSVSACRDDSDNTITGNWSYFGESRATARTQVASFTIGDTAAYFIGGYYYNNKEYWYKEVWKATLNSSGDYLSWMQLDSMPETCLIRTGAVAFSIGNKGYYGLGYSGKTGVDSTQYKYLNDFWEFDPSKPKGSMWTQMTDYPVGGIEGATGFGDNVNNIGYVIDGIDDMVENATYTFDPNIGTTGTWTKLYGANNEFPGYGRYYGMSFTIDNKTYVLGGINSNGEYLYDFFVFNPSANNWSKLNFIKNELNNESFDDDYTMQRKSGSTFVLNGKGYLTLGYKGGVLIDTWEYNPNDDRWTRKTAFESTKRTMANGFTLSNRAFVCFGRNSSSYYNEIYEFQPDAEKDRYDN
jgi:N-acetylneuraminic acid mutarotase